MRVGFFHLSVSALVAGLAAGIVFVFWFPFPYLEISGGRELFWLVVGVDVVCGPLLTSVLSSPTKSHRERLVDWSLVIGLQICAMVYGFNTLAIARPVAMVFEVDRFRVVTAADIAPSDLALAAPKQQKLSWTGPELKGIRSAFNGDEQLRSIELSLQGIEPSMRPHWWQDYASSVPQVLAKAKPVAELKRKHPTQSVQIDDGLNSAGLSDANGVWLPLVSRKTSEWVVILDTTTAQPKAYLPLDGF